MIAMKEQQGRLFPGHVMNARRLLFVAAIAGYFVVASPVQAYRRGYYSHSYSSMLARQRQFMHQAAASQINAAKQVLADAESTGNTARAKIDASLAKLREEAQKFHDAQSVTRHAAKELAEIEAEIIDEQTSDSPYKQAVKNVESARQNFQQVEDRVLADSTVQAKLAGLTGVSLQEAKTKILEFDDKYVGAKAELHAQGGSVARLRTELFQADKHWKEAAETLTQARKDEKAAEEMTHSGASGRVGLTWTAKNASEAAAVARAAIAQAEGVLRATGGGRYLNNSPGFTGSRNQPARNSNR
ncbi:MAG TPA: hypothetical protein VGI40_21760 [Pirellulaceae bacterium]|jgi:hypothetical protein